MPRKGSNGPYGVGRDVTRLIKGALKQNGLTQRQVAYFAGMSESQVSRILSFEKEMTIDQCEDLCIAVGLTIFDVFELAVDERVWNREGEFYVDGHLVATDPLDAHGRFLLRRDSAEREDENRSEIRETTRRQELNSHRGLEQEDLPYAAMEGAPEPEEGDDDYGPGA